MTKPSETDTQVMEPAVSEAKTLVLDRAEPAPLPPPPAAPSLPPLQRKATFQMISMKSPAEIAAEKDARVAKPIAAVQMRSIAEAGRHVPTPPGGLGFLAPPRDPAAEPRGLSSGVYVLLMVVGALALATVIATAMWFLAYR